MAANAGQVQPRKQAAYPAVAITERMHPGHAVMTRGGRLRQLAGFKDYESFASAHRKWVKDALEKNDTKRDRRWTSSIAAGSSHFTERIKNAMGTMARGRTIRSIEDGFELRESQSAYNVIFDPENRDIGTKRTNFLTYFI